MRTTASNLRPALVTLLAALACWAGTASSPATDLVGGEQPEMLSPEEALETFTLHPDYEINLYASEVDMPLESPAAMTFDARGRLWVANIPSQPHAEPGVPTEDSIVILEDTDQDGVADASTVFRDDLYLPMGFALAHGGREVYAISESDLLRLTDEDGDGVADEKEILLHGWGTEDNHHVISGFEWSPGGRLFFGQGMFLNTQVETPHGPVRVRGAAAFRFDPRDHHLSVHASHGWSNLWGIAFDRWGGPLLTDASPAYNYWMDHFAANFTYPKPDKYADDRPTASLSFTPVGRRPACGNEILASAHFPEEVRGWFLTTQMKSWHGIRWYQLEGQGSGVKATQPYATEDAANELLTCSDIIFRPVALEIGPDGALYVLDYHNPIVGHTTYSFRDPRHIKSYGRVWRITHEDRPLDRMPEIVGRPIPELLEFLDATNRCTVSHARREIQERPAEKVLAATDAWLDAEDPAEPGFERARVEALWMHQSANDPDFDLLRRVLASDEAKARNAGLRVLRYWQRHLPAEESLALYREAVADENQRCRLSAVTGLSYHEEPAAALEVAAGVLERDMDEGMTHATRQVFEHLVEVGGTTVPAVTRFLHPYREDEELLDLELTEAVAEEIITREIAGSVMSREVHREALAVLAGDETRALREAVSRLSRAESPDDATLAALAPTLVAWPPAELRDAEPLLRGLMKTGNTSPAKIAAEAALYRAGVVTEPEQASPAPTTVAAAAARAGRGHVPEALFPVVAGLAEEKKSKRHHTAAIRALPLFPSRDAEALELLAATADRYADRDDLRTSFAAIDAMNRIPETATPRPPDYRERTVETVTVSATANLRFDPATFTVEAGSAVRLTFRNPDSLYHNLVVIEKGALQEVGLLADQMAGDPDGLEKDYIPDDPRVLHATPQITLGAPGGRSHALRFYAPTEPGDYPYVCTFPGHWRTMQGVMKVVE